MMTPVEDPLIVSIPNNCPVAENGERVHRTTTVMVSVPGVAVAQVITALVVPDLHVTVGNPLESAWFPMCEITASLMSV
jgi:hypothetical protein